MWKRTKRDKVVSGLPSPPGTVNGNTISGTTVESWNVFVSGMSLLRALAAVNRRTAVRLSVAVRSADRRNADQWINENVHVESVRDDVETFVLDAEVLEGKGSNTHIIVERIVNDIDEIIRKVRFPDWQSTSQGERLVQKGTSENAAQVPTLSGPRAVRPRIRRKGTMRYSANARPPGWGAGSAGEGGQVV